MDSKAFITQKPSFNHHKAPASKDTKNYVLWSFSSPSSLCISQTKTSMQLVHTLRNVPFIYILMVSLPFICYFGDTYLFAKAFHLRKNFNSGIHFVGY